MSSTAQKFVYAIQAEYRGKNELASLSDDLKSIGRIESFQKMQDDFAKTTEALVDAKTKMRSLKDLMQQPGGTAFAAEYERSVAQVQKLSSSLQSQKATLDSSRASLQAQGVAVGDLANVMQTLQGRVEGQGRVFAAYRSLGIQSFSSIQNQVTELETAYKNLEASGELSASELAKAWEVVERKSKSLKAQMEVIEPPSAKFQAMAHIGVKSFADIEDEIVKTTKAWEVLENSDLSWREKIVYGEKFKAKIKGLKEETNGWAKSLSGVQESWGGLLAAFSGGAALGATVSQFATFDDAMLRVKAVAGATGDEMLAMRDKAKELGSTTRYTSTEAAQGMAELAATGMDAKEVMDTLPSAMNMAAIAGGDVKTSADQLTDIMSQFGLKTEDAGHAADVLVAGYTGASTSLDELGLAMKYVGPMSAVLGYSLEDTTGILQALAEAGYKGEKAGTALRGGMARLLKPTADATAVLEEHNIQVFDSTGKVRDFADIIGDLGDASLTPREMLDLFGQEAGPGMMALLGQGADAIRDYQTKLGDVDGKAAETAAMMESGIGGSLRRLWASFTEAGNSIASAFAPAIIWVANLASDLVSAFANAPAIVHVLAGTFGVAAVSMMAWTMGFAPLISAARLAFANFLPLNTSLGTTLVALKALPGRALSASAGLLTMAQGSRLLGFAMKSIPLVGLIWGLYEGAKALGIWDPFINTLQQGLIALASTVHLAALRVRWFWNVVTGDDAEAQAIEQRISEVDQMYFDMFQKVGQKSEDQVSLTGESQAKITKKIADGGKEQIEITEDTVETLKQLYGSVGGVDADGETKDKDGKEGGKKVDPNAPKTDEFGRTEADIANRKKNEDIKRARKSGDMTGFKKVKNADGTVQWDYDDSPEAQAKVKAKEEAKTPTKVYGKDGKWQYHYGDRSGLTKIAEDKYTKTANNINARVGSASAGLDKAVASKQASESKKTVELKLGSAKLAGDQAGVDAFIEELKRAGMAAA